MYLVLEGLSVLGRGRCAGAAGGWEHDDARWVWRCDGAGSRDGLRGGIVGSSVGVSQLMGSRGCSAGQVQEGGTLVRVHGNGVEWVGYSLFTAPC